jgi:hypothetical protein
VHLQPCPACGRHFVAHESQCPFCLSARTPCPELPPEATQRLGRAAIMALGAVAATASLACTPAAQTAGNAQSADAGADASQPVPPPINTVPVAPPYGAPPADGLLGVV